ncbi:MAG: DoxX family protein [Candidatus Acidiferrales bacterium]
MANSSGSVTSLVGRILISLIFLMSGIEKATGFSATAGFLVSRGVPLAAAATGLAMIVELLGGIAVLAGFQTRVASWILFLYLIPTTLLIHNFWSLQGEARMDSQTDFLKNLAIMGGLLILAANGAGGISADAHRARTT